MKMTIRRVKTWNSMKKWNLTMSRPFPRMPPAMKFALAAAAFALLLLQQALAYPAPLPGTEPIPQLMEKADLVCKGLVTSAPPTIVGDNYQEKTGVAQVRVDRCFKGDPQSGEIPVLFNWIVPAAGAPIVALKTGDYFLFFLKRQSNGRYLPFDDFFSTLQISRLLGDAPREADSMQLLELDLKAGLKDTDQELMLDGIRMLGNMRHIRSTRELKDLEQNPDLLIRTYVSQALMRLQIIRCCRVWLSSSRPNRRRTGLSGCRTIDCYGCNRSWPGRSVKSKIPHNSPSSIN